MNNWIDELVFLEKNKILGEGAFSEVIKVRDKNDNKIYALKKVDQKDEFKNYIQRRHDKFDQRDITSLIIVTSEHNKILQKLSKYAGNGCLFFYIHSQQGLPENLALRFFYQTALAVKNLHDQNLIHRDIKPENILLDDDFNVKLCDFGWSCFLENDDFRTSVCGTYEYMSPEIVHSKFHTNKVDIWCLGVLLYEMLHGSPPFKADNFSQIREEFLSKNILIKKSISKDTKNLLKNILRIDDSKRYDIDQVVNHSVFSQKKQQFQQPLTEIELSILLRNYLLNTDTRGKRSMPEALTVLMDKKKQIINTMLNLQDIVDENKYQPQDQNFGRDSFYNFNKLEFSNQQETDNKIGQKDHNQQNFKKKQNAQQLIVQTVEKTETKKNSNQEVKKHTFQKRVIQQTQADPQKQYNGAKVQNKQQVKQMQFYNDSNQHISNFTKEKNIQEKQVVIGDFQQKEKTHILEKDEKVLDLNTNKPLIYQKEDYGLENYFQKDQQEQTIQEYQNIQQDIVQQEEPQIFVNNVNKDFDSQYQQQNQVCKDDVNTDLEQKFYKTQFQEQQTKQNMMQQKNKQITHEDRQFQGYQDSVNNEYFSVTKIYKSGEKITQLEDDQKIENMQNLQRNSQNEKIQKNSNNQINENLKKPEITRQRTRTPNKVTRIKIQSRNFNLSKNPFISSFQKITSTTNIEHFQRSFSQVKKIENNKENSKRHSEVQIKEDTVKRDKDQQKDQKNSHRQSFFKIDIGSNSSIQNQFKSANSIEENEINTKYEQTTQNNVFYDEYQYQNFEPSIKKDKKENLNDEFLQKENLIIRGRKESISPDITPQRSLTLQIGLNSSSIVPDNRENKFQPNFVSSRQITLPTNQIEQVQKRNRSMSKVTTRRIKLNGDVKSIIKKMFQNDDVQNEQKEEAEVKLKKQSLNKQVENPPPKLRQNFSSNYLHNDKRKQENMKPIQIQRIVKRISLWEAKNN